MSAFSRTLISPMFARKPPSCRFRRTATQRRPKRMSTLREALPQCANLEGAER
ncbi:hypothetical protein KCP78_07560 [Salmonella enterica subsp. enterica]|nr:hypothetical protein KCP78_07560 [Salmonella enterica subsp. enterica]